jgi:uncharacterized protein (TIGR01440 family)
MTEFMKKLKEDLNIILDEVIENSHLNEGDIFILGCSSSEVLGEKIGTHSSKEIGDLIIDTIKAKTDEKKLFLAVQGCEHINRGITIERSAAKQNNFEIVQVVPSLHAGGACSLAAYERFSDPVVVEYIVAQAGIDIGDTFIGQHINHVQVPIRPSIKELGAAHVTAAFARPKFIGGPRAKYSL